jgi:LPXTG-motif cell wall-anchored protein
MIIVAGITSNFALPPVTGVTVGPSSTSSPSPTALPPSDGGSKSKAWIAGAVVGPLVGLALIGLAAFFFMRRRKNAAHNKHVAPATGSMPPAGATAYQQNSYSANPASSPQPPQYYPNMQQTAGAAPFGVAKQDTYYPPGGNPQSPVTSQGSQSPYGAPQQWQQPGGQPVYGAPAPQMNPSPQPQNVQPAQYMAGESRPFSSELEGSETVNVQPKK